MAYKKQMLEKYLNLHESQHESQQELHQVSHELPYKSNNFGSIDDIICEKNTLEIHNSLLRYENFKLLKENKLLKTKLQTNIEEKKQEMKFLEFVEWEMTEGINYRECLYNTSYFSNKRKVDTIDTHDTHDTQDTHEIKKIKVINEISMSNRRTSIITTNVQTSKTSKTSKKSNDVIVIYDSDETDTDVEDNSNTYQRNTTSI
jgi:hypothetical protein